jgi:hypothetical protein
MRLFVCADKESSFGAGAIRKEVDGRNTKATLLAKNFMEVDVALF